MFGCEALLIPNTKLIPLCRNYKYFLSFNQKIVNDFNKGVPTGTNDRLIQFTDINKNNTQRMARLETLKAKKTSKKKLVGISAENKQILLASKGYPIYLTDYVYSIHDNIQLSFDNPEQFNKFLNDTKDHLSGLNSPTKLNSDISLEGSISDKVSKYNKSALELLEARNYSSSLVDYVKVNSKNVIMKLKNLDELEKILLIPNLRQSRFDTIEKDRKDVIAYAELVKLRNRRDLLRARGFPYLICPWTKINEDHIVLTFKSSQDFSYFLAIQNDILEFCNAKKSKLQNIAITN